MMYYSSLLYIVDHLWAFVHLAPLGFRLWAKHPVWLIGLRNFPPRPSDGHRSPIAGWFIEWKI